MTSAPPPAGDATALLGGATDPQDLSRPLYGARFGTAVRRFLRKYAAFTGRASRSEFWWAYLAIVLIELVPWVVFMIGIITSAVWANNHMTETSLGYDANGNEIVYETAPGIIHAPTWPVVVIGLVLMALVTLALIVPIIALMCRRLHDANLSGLLCLLLLVPSIGGLVVLVLALLPSSPEGRRFDTA